MFASLKRLIRASRPAPVIVPPVQLKGGVIGPMGPAERAAWLAAGGPEMSRRGKARWRVKWHAEHPEHTR